MMPAGSFEIFENKAIIRFNNRICETPDELLTCELFRIVLQRCSHDLYRRKSPLLKIFGKEDVGPSDLDTLVKTFQFLAKMSGDLVPNVVKGSDVFLKEPTLLNDFVEHLYNYWRSFERFIVCDSTGDDLDKRPYRTFNNSIEKLTHLIRGVYRDIQENITHYHQRIFRQTIAGAELACIAVGQQIPFGHTIYQKLNNISVIRQILLYPPLILDQLTNKRSGKFERVHKNPIESLEFRKEDWLCYPAKVGPLLILIYFYKRFFELGHSLCNLFQLAEDEELHRKPDAVYTFGVPGGALKSFGDFPTVFYDDEENQILSAAVPSDDVFGYFGYLKKMVLTLHNIIMMKRGKFPFHGALVKMTLKGNHHATILFIGDTGAGKSETLEALRLVGEDSIQDFNIIADDMGSLDLDPQGHIIGYGTEIGAFLRLDDLQPGYALGQIDRAIILSPNKINARIILPVTSFENLIKGHKIDYVLYANNYENLDEEHPMIERFQSSDQAMKVFREGTVMSKGTTTTQGIVHSYFANIFGPPQYKELHDPLAEKFLKAFFADGIFVGQIRTRLGLPGWERQGPEEAARELFKIIAQG